MAQLAQIIRSPGPKEQKKTETERPRLCWVLFRFIFLKQILKYLGNVVLKLIQQHQHRLNFQLRLILWSRPLVICVMSIALGIAYAPICVLPTPLELSASRGASLLSFSGKPSLFYFSPLFFDQNN